MDFDFEKCREVLDASDVEALIAIRLVIDAIPHSLPLLPLLYAKHQVTSSPALRSRIFASIRRFEELAIPFILKLLNSDDAWRRCDGIDLLVDRYQPSVRITHPLLPSRPTTKPNWGEHHVSVVEMLKTKLLDPIREVRVRAAAGLDDLGETPPDYVQILVDGLNADDAITCYTSACYLGRMEAAAVIAIPALREFIERRSRIATDGRVIRPIHAAQISIRRIQGTEYSYEPDS